MHAGSLCSRCHHDRGQLRDRPGIRRTYPRLRPKLIACGRNEVTLKELQNNHFIIEDFRCDITVRQDALAPAPLQSSASSVAFNDKIP